VASADDIRRVSAAGAEAVIVGKALYEGKLTLEQALAV
jgi:phosphoribosylformimino-5-aminoimidazole carboxamide ribotide isomerase